MFLGTNYLMPEVELEDTAVVWASEVLVWHDDPVQ